MKKRVVALGGDGVGPEIMEVTCEILRKANFNLEILEPMHGEAAQKLGKEVFPEEVKNLCLEADAILFGAQGGISRPILDFLRWGLDNFVNIRPIKYYGGVDSPLKDSQGIDFVILRENTEGEYPAREGDLSFLAQALPDFKDRLGKKISEFGAGKFAVRVISEKGGQRLAEYACIFARERKKQGYPGKITIVTKANVLTQSDGLFQRIVTEECQKNPDLTYEHFHVDDAARRLVRFPKAFDVIVTPNLYGDILADEAAELVGGLGLAPSGVIGGKKPYFEPVHGSAPDIAGLGIVNPTAMILSAKMILEHLNMKEEANSLERAVVRVYEERKYLTPDQGGKASTKEFAQAVLRKVH
ncbi:MAG: isocitrate/isopropylmalate dehydrogenase family protein [Thermodesulfobacteriota bacterium]